MSAPVVIRQLFVSPPYPHHFSVAGENATVPVSAITFRAGDSVGGGPLYGLHPDPKGQVTFFSWEVYEAAKQRFRLPLLDHSAFRRNVLIEGIDLNALIGTEFSIGGIEFLGTDEAPPSYWMNNAIAPGVEAWLRGNGGLRVRVLSEGELRVGRHTLTVLAEQMAMGAYGGG